MKNSFVSYLMLLIRAFPSFVLADLTTVLTVDFQRENVK